MFASKTSENPGKYTGSLPQGRGERGPDKSPIWLTAPCLYTEVGTRVDNPASAQSTGVHGPPGMALSPPPVFSRPWTCPDSPARAGQGACTAGQGHTGTGGSKAHCFARTWDSSWDHPGTPRGLSEGWPRGPRLLSSRAFFLAR